MMAARRPEKLQRKREQKARKRRERLDRKGGYGPIAGDPHRGGGDIVVLAPPGYEKMSDVLKEFVRPYLKEAFGNIEDVRKLFMLGEFAWNTAILPENEQQQIVDKLLAEGLKGADARELVEVKGLINELIARKNAYFPGNRRIITDVQVEARPGDYYISVMSTLDVPEIS
jgi:hypothetical protein